MPNMYPLSNQSDFEVMISSQLSDSERNIIIKLYMPIVGDKAISLYQTLFSFVSNGSFESEIIHHEVIVKTMHLRSIERFLTIREQLESIGLMDSFYKDNTYVYLMKKPLEAPDFFNNIELSTLLEYQIGKDQYLNTYCEFLMRRLNIDKFEKINKSFDEVFNIETSENILISQNIFSGRNNGIVLDNKKFDFKCFSVMLQAHNVLNDTYFTDQNFIDCVKRYSFLYQLSEDEMRDVIIRSVDINRNVSFEEISKNAKNVYSNRGKQLGVVPKNHKIVKKSNKAIDYLNQATPTEFVEKYTGIKLTSSEIEMFDRLLIETNITIGMLNVAILYVLKELDNQIPSYNYFLKIINTWRRAGVNSIEGAFEYINKPASTKKYKKTKDLPSWYEGYIKEVSNPKDDIKENEKIEDLEDFFSNKKE